MKNTSLSPVTSLSDLAHLARMSPSYARLAIISAQNLGGDVTTLERAIRWLNLTANETSEEGVVDEINFCI